MLSIITPSYNRGYLLNRLYRSLQNQNNSNFEWIIVDDGSTDDTKEIVLNIVNEDNAFPIIYTFQQNGGKHRAVNRAVRLAKGEYIFIVDSDDYITDDAVNIIESWCNLIKDNREIAGVSGLRAYADGRVIGGAGNVISGGFIEATNLQRKQNNLLGDKAEVYKREVLLKYPFPEFAGEKFLPEEAVWNAIAKDGYRLRWYNRVIYYTEYLEDGLTYAVKYGDLQYNNFAGYTYVVALNLKCYRNIKTKSMVFINYYNMAKIKGCKFMFICGQLKIKVYEGIVYFCLGSLGTNLINILKNMRR